MRRAIVAPAGFAWCSAHQEFHPVDAFGRDRSRANGLSGNCKAWKRVAQRDYDARRQAANGPALNRQRSARRGRAGETEKKRRRAASLRSAKRAVSTRADRRRLGLEPGVSVTCYYCGESVEQVGDICVNGVVLSRPLAPDHVVSLARGGDDTPANQVPACSRCNSTKSDRYIVEWRAHRIATGATPTRGGLFAAHRSRSTPLP
jgi:5-methylcytosine-specific restriction endonuclease McrA